MRHEPDPSSASAAADPGSVAHGLERGSIEREALMRVALASVTATALDDVIELIAAAAHTVIGQGAVSIRRWEEPESAMRSLINVGDLGAGTVRRPTAELYPAAKFREIETLLRDQAPYFTAIDDPDGDPAAIAALRRLGKESAIGVPILVDEDVWGEVWAATNLGAPRFRGRDLRFLEAIAAQLAAVNTRSQRFTRVSRMAYEDALTGLPNRRALDERLDLALHRFEARGVPVTVLLCDLDGLKQINDERGHEAGDAALRRAAEALVQAAATVPHALVGRLSGDEFAAIVEGGTVEEALEIATSTLALLDDTSTEPLSLSCGVATAVPSGDTRRTLLRAADTAQYAAKRRGGGMVCTAIATESGVDVSDGPTAPLGDRISAQEGLELGAETLLAELDGELASALTLDRLELVAAGFAELTNAAAWAISYAAQGDDTIRAIVAADDRDSRLRGTRVGLENETFELARFPLTQRIVAAGAGSFVIEAGDPQSDPSELALLAELGFDSLLAVAASDVDGVYLVEVFGDADSTELRQAELRASLLARAAAVPSLDLAARVGGYRRRLRRLSATGALGARLAGTVDVETILEAAAEQLHQGLGFEMCSVMRLVGEEIEIVAARGHLAERLLAEGWTQPAGLGLIGRALRERAIVCVGDVGAEPDYRSVPDALDPGSEMTAPLWAGDTLWGVLDVGDSQRDAFDADDVGIIRVVADQVSASLRSASLYEQLESAYIGTAEALGAALSAKDAATAAHSRSIGAHAEAVGRLLGLEDNQLRDVRLAAALHDIGKLAVPEAILTKPGPLTAQERVTIEQHTVAGAEILAPVGFLAEVVPLVRAGHERWDGTGYPDRLAGEAIPLGARIVFACDAYDAMTSDRPYRPAMSHEQAVTELQACAGTQFDPRVIEGLLRALSDERL